MGKITSITAQRRPGRYNVMVDGVFALAIAEKVLVDLGLAAGKEVDEAELREVSSAEELHRALSAGLRFLEVRARSEREIAERLKMHGYDPGTVCAAINKLRAYGLVDDNAFTTAWIESRSRSQPGGKRKLRSELTLKGVARDTIDGAICEITEEAEFDLARKALTKRRLAIFSTREEQQAAYLRDAGFLARRGFGWGIANKVLKERYGSPPDTEDP